MAGGAINWGRVWLGGLLAAVVVGALGFVVWLLFLGDTAAGGILLQPTTASIALWLGAIYGISTFAVWLYAGLRPRYGPGPWTAARAGLAVWFVTSLTDLLWMMVLTQGADARVSGSVLAAMAAYAVVFPLATMAGAWPYAEASPGVGRTGRAAGEPGRERTGGA